MTTHRAAAGRVVLCVQNLSVPQDPRVWREARDLAAAGYAVTAICPGGPGLARREILQGVDIVRWPPPKARNGLLGQVTETLAALVWTTLHCFRLRVRGRIAVLHAANPPDTFFLVGLLLRPFGTRFVFDQHDASPELLLVKSGERPLQDRLLRFLERASYRTAHLVVAPNGSYRRMALERGGKDERDVVVVRSGPDSVEPRDGEPGVVPPVVAFAGAMDEQDGVHLLIAAAADILRRRPGAFRLELIGAGDNVEALRRQADELGIGDVITWPGWVPLEELRRRLRDASIAVSPDEDTPFTRISTMTKVTDYLGVGLPCVVADLPENLVTGANAVVYYPAGDAVELSKRLEELLDDPALRADLSRRARARAEELLWRHSRDALVKAYGRMVGSS